LLGIALVGHALRKQLTDARLVSEICLLREMMTGYAPPSALLLPVNAERTLPSISSSLNGFIR
jgi:hypothetical protein